MNLIVLPELLVEPQLPKLTRGAKVVKHHAHLILTIENFHPKVMEELGQEFCPDSEEIRHLT